MIRESLESNDITSFTGYWHTEGDISLMPSPDTGGENPDDDDEEADA